MSRIKKTQWSWATWRGISCFEDVWFSYDGENMVLKDINLDVKPGQTVAILGATGSRKEQHNQPDTTVL